MSRVSLQTNFYMTHEDQVLIAEMAVTSLTWETMVMNVISRPINAAMELNTIAKFHKYRGFHEGHRFIPLAMEVHGTLGCDMDCFIQKCVHLFYNRQSRIHLFVFLHSIFQTTC
jgi:hypothetical protein